VARGVTLRHAPPCVLPRASSETLSASASASASALPPQLADGRAVMTFNARQLLHIEPLGEKQARGGAALAR
jgi:hypothetical protein